MCHLQRVLGQGVVEGNTGALAWLRWGYVRSLRPLQQKLVGASPPAWSVRMLLKRAGKAPLVSHCILLAELSQEEDRPLGHAKPVGLHSVSVPEAAERNGSGKTCHLRSYH